MHLLGLVVMPAVNVVVVTKCKTLVWIDILSDIRPNNFFFSFNKPVAVAWAIH